MQSDATYVVVQLPSLGLMPFHPTRITLHSLPADNAPLCILDPVHTTLTCSCPFIESLLSYTCVNPFLVISGQEEIRYPDGSSQITFPDGSLKRIGADGAEEMSFPDGTRVQVLPSGERTLHLANGEREVHTAEYKVRKRCQCAVSDHPTERPLPP